MTEKEVLNTAEAADFLGISAYTVRRYAREKTLSARKTGKQYLFLKADLVAWVRGKDTAEEKAG